MVRVSIEVQSGASRFRVGVQASNIQRAVNVVRGLYSASDVRGIFPIESRMMAVNNRSPSSRVSSRDISIDNSPPSLRSPTSSVVPPTARFARSQVAAQSAHAEIPVSFRY